jgi:quercetin dioxygenase-like cupin family protein
MAEGDIVDGPDGERIVLAGVGQRIVFENHQVRVWEIALEPGERQAWHQHHNPYLVIALGAADNRIDPIEGEPRLVHEDTGGVVYREPGEVHMLTNHGDTPYLSRLVELKYLGESAPEH